MIAIVAGIIGVFIGTILNLLADYLPDYNLPGRPLYTDGTPRPPAAWMGLTAFLLNKRSSPQDTSAVLSWRYPITEIATGLMFYLTVRRAGYLTASELDIFISPVQLMFWLIYIAVFVLITVIDIEHRLILFSVTIPSMVIALIDAALPLADPTLRNALLGGALGFGIFLLFYGGGFLYTSVSAEIRGVASNEVAFGYGDVILALLCGFILGWQPMIFAMFITVILGAAGAVFYLVSQKLTRGSGGLTTPLPYGPYIIVGTVAMLLFAPEVREFLLNAVY